MGGFVAIEGLDGVGKSTVVQQLAKHFSGHAMSTPGPELFDCREAVLQAFAGDELAKALFYTASVSSQGRKAGNLAKRGEWVFMDRYWASTLAYAKARGVTAELDQLGKSLIQPDLTVLLILDETERQRRLHGRGATVEDLESLAPDFRQRVSEELNTHANLVLNISGYKPQAACAITAQAIQDTLRRSRSFAQS
ncbi:AAA family ATPase [Halomonas sp. THAF5a]|uniref:dTMP kinase n=1 Tax=Halomonas sp. THAF5a TaxID=2587844 RepID=UPI0015621E56|nr:AAA family ATPase [Halomonas sp. THAF5a]